MFVTVFYGVLEAVTGRLTYASAGHDPPFLRRASGAVEPLMPTGPLMGVIEELEIGDATVELEAGDALLAYTDGVSEASGPTDFYGSERVIAATDRTRCGGDELLDAVMADVEEFTQGRPRVDDLTLMTVGHRAGR